MLLGSHVSIRNGYLSAAKEAVSLGAKSFQYFPKNPRSLSVKSFDRRNAENCSRYCKEHGLVSVAHTPYPTNLSVEDPVMREVTLRSLLNDLDITEACGSVGLVVHFGKYNGSDPLQGYRLMIDMLNQVLMDWDGNAKLLIENMAGQGGKMGITLEELVQIRRLTQVPEKIGYCFDTCHAFASGLWTGDNWSAIMEKGTELGYFDNLKAIHLNDSVYPGRSFKDRHANVGKGYIGERSIKELLNASGLTELPFILETPYSADYSHREELRYVHSLIAK
ncbi:deoxyribonuclease IV [Paenibacillus sp. N4]|uniref:deoxyribonuclease IV n=1 Tax=Paenibacillus vietnamensis TaxID=2590547 RepID=UPI001CD0C422|nr:deoxyribonuclease IV [Paenibacillus vietnamensis]MCA0758517.1 deoxyribonuclease IV [Paenibacillus vietnamensis]